MSSLSRGEAGSAPPGSVIFDAPLPVRTPVAPASPPKPTATEAAGEIAADVIAEPGQEADSSSPQPPSPASDAADSTDSADASVTAKSTNATPVPSGAAGTRTPTTKARKRATEKRAAATAAATEEADRSVFDHSQVIAFYGSPISDQLGVLGMFPPDELAQRLRDEAGIYDNLNGDRLVTPALDLIYAQAQGGPTDNGRFLEYLDDWTVY